MSKIFGFPRPMVNFKYPHLEREFDDELCEEVRAVVGELAAWSEAESLPIPVITEVTRTDQMQLNYYTPYGWKLFTGRDEDGDRHILSAGEMIMLREIKEEIRNWASNELGIAMWALKRWTWHRISHAVDLRNSHYSMAQLTKVVGWMGARIRQLEDMSPGRQWSFLVHDIGRGGHMHLEYKNRAAQAEFLKRWKPDLSQLQIPKHHGA